MPTNDPLVYILVLHWRGIDHTRACLASVDKLRYGNFKILLVDNGSASLPDQSDSPQQISSIGLSGAGGSKAQPNPSADLRNSDGSSGLSSPLGSFDPPDSSDTPGKSATSGTAQHADAQYFEGALLQTEFPSTEVLRLDENKGFSGGCNAGISYALEKSADFIWILNNDTVVRPDVLSQLVDAAGKDVRAAAVSAAVLDSVSRTDLGTASAEATIAGKGVLDFARGKSLLKRHEGNQPVQCDWLAASNLLLRATAIANYSSANGVFDERYFLYFEDTELCHRLNLAGWKCFFVPEAKISHVGGASTTDKIKHWRSYYHTRNRLLFFSESSPPALKYVCLASIYLHILRHRFTLPRKGEEGIRQLNAELLGVKDFQRGKFGKCTELDSY